MLEGGMTNQKADYKGSSERHVIIDRDSDRWFF